MLLSLFALAIILTIVGLLFNQGLWSVLIALVNVVFAGLIATNTFEPLADRLGKGNTADFFALWLLFVGAFVVLRYVTDSLSRANVVFDSWVDQIGAVSLSLVVGWVLVCFSTFSLHVAPLGRTAFGGAFMETPDAKMLGVGPDRLWLAFMHRQSKAALGRDADHVFDPEGEFVYKYATRRGG
jgi:hypothetical protein